MEQNTSNTSSPAEKNDKSHGLGIAGLILGILAVVIAFIPCLGIWALVPGLIGLVLSAVSMAQAGKVNAPKGMAIAGLVCSILGCGVAATQWFALKKTSDVIEEGIESIDTAKIRQSLNIIINEADKLDDKEESDSAQSK